STQYSARHRQVGSSSTSHSSRLRHSSSNELGPLHCLRAIKFYERKYNIPTNLLRAVSVIESGGWIKEYKAHIPWPWALNVEGKSYVFHNKQEAAVFLRSVIAHGIKNVDIGCSQINWYHHGQHFKDPESLLNPVYNVAYAAYLLARNFHETQKWSTAVARYHSKNFWLGQRYLNKVEAMWHKVSANSDAYNNFKFSELSSKKSHINKNSIERYYVNSGIETLDQNATNDIIVYNATGNKNTFGKGNIRINDNNGENISLNSNDNSIVVYNAKSDNSPSNYSENYSKISDIALNGASNNTTTIHRDLIVTE
ncbi:MAG: transglycosylase SLT domain-containing protein, partial [Proteobacteria bacterium]|nr:transglycosylase SLT domain-containing protein [Pseudomonadota bacterium]